MIKSVPTSFPATLATIGQADVAVGPDGSLYFVDQDNGIIYQQARGGSPVAILGQVGIRDPTCADGTAASGATSAAQSVAVGPDGLVYFTEFTSGACGASPWTAVRKIDAAGTIQTVIHPDDLIPFVDPSGAPILVALNIPQGLAFRPDGTLYVADTGNSRIVERATGGTLTSVAGNAQLQATNTNWTGCTIASTCPLYKPTDVAVGPDGSLYVSDSQEHAVGRIWPSGLFTTFAGASGMQDGCTGDNQAATSVLLEQPHVRGRRPRRYRLHHRQPLLECSFCRSSDGHHSDVCGPRPRCPDDPAVWSNERRWK